MSTNISNKIIIEEEGVVVSSNNIINFTGAGVTVTNVDGIAQVYIPSPPSGLTYKGLWDANLNSPILASSVGTQGDFYIVSVAGTTDLNGVTDWQVSDWAIFEGGVWQKIDNHDIQAYNTVKDESSILPQRSTLKFVGDGVIATDSTGETVVTIPGNIPTTNYGLYTQTSSSTPVTNTLTESSLLDGGIGTLTVPANGFKVGDSFHAVLTGHINSVNNHTLHIRVKTDGIALADTGVMTMATATTKHWKLEIEFTIRAIGASGVAKIAAGGAFFYTKNASTSFEGINFSTETTIGFDTTISNTLAITAQWGTANTGDSIFSEIFILSKTY